MAASFQPPVSVELACSDPRDRYACAVRSFHFAQAVGFDRARASAIALCAAELASNAVRHGGGGCLTINLLQSPRRGVELVCRDSGPGIADPVAAMRDGWSRGRARTADDPWWEGLGAGLGAVHRLADEIEIETPSGGGALVRARKWL